MLSSIKDPMQKKSLGSTRRVSERVKSSRWERAAVCEPAYWSTGKLASRPTGQLARLVNWQESLLRTGRNSLTRLKSILLLPTLLNS